MKSFIKKLPMRSRRWNRSAWENKGLKISLSLKKSAQELEEIECGGGRGKQKDTPSETFEVPKFERVSGLNCSSLVAN